MIRFISRTTKVCLLVGVLTAALPPLTASADENTATANCLQGIRDRQIIGGAFDGAFRMTADTNQAWIENYFGLEAALALLAKTPSAQAPDTARVAKFLTWYANQALQESEGVAHNYDGQLPTPTKLSAPKDYDSIDSYAGLYLLATARYYNLTHTLPPQALAGAVRSLEAVDSVINSKEKVKDNDGGNYDFNDAALKNGLPLSRGRAGTHYLIDACETYAGLRESVAFFSAVGKSAEAQKAETLANGISNGVSLFDRVATMGSYAYVVDNGNNPQYPDSSHNRYLGALANLFALAYLSPTPSTLWSDLRREYHDQNGELKAEQIADDSKAAPEAPSEWWLIAATRVAPGDTSALRTTVISNADKFTTATYIPRLAVTVLALVDGAARYPTLPQTSSTRGKVYNAVARTGLSGIVVKAVRSGTNLVSAQTTTDAQGAYNLALPTGNYTLLSYLPAAPTTFPVVSTFANPVQVSATGLTGYDFRAVGIGGRLINSANAGVGGVTLKLYAKKDTGLKNALRTVTSDGQGFFSFDGIVPGSWNIVPTSPTTYTYTPNARLITVENKAVFTSFAVKAK